MSTNETFRNLSELPWKILTIDVVWCWAILQGHKPLENRTWSTSHRGLLGIHAGKNRTRRRKNREIAERAGLTPPSDDYLDILQGHLLGVVDLVDVLTLSHIQEQEFHQYDRRLVTGPYCFQLESPRWLETPTPLQGQLRLWQWSPNFPKQIKLCSP